jgi:hypothetical protein
MILLQDHESFADIAALNPESRSVEWRKRDQGSPTRTSGWIGKIGKEQVLLYKRGGKLRLLARGHECDADRADVLLASVGADRNFKFRCDGNSILDVTYTSPLISPLINDILSPGEDEENYDFAILVYNILTNPARMNVCLETWP